VAEPIVELKKIENNFNIHPHWAAVVQVCQKLSSKNYSAWLAGGCVRDGLLGVPPKDFDVATNAKPSAVQELFEKTINIGKQFGIIMIPFSGFQIEVATFRKDGPYKDGRHPESIVFTTPEEDARRRDFTINGLFWDMDKKQVVDYVDGVKDINSRIIRAVGNPIDRFKEDKLRMLRAIRFAGELDFEIEEETFRACQTNASLLSEVSRERIRDELLKILKSKKRTKAISLLDHTYLLEQIFPDLDFYAQCSQAVALFSRTKLALKYSKQGAGEGLLLSLFLIYAAVAKAGGDYHKASVIALDCLENLKCSNRLKESVSQMIGNWGVFSSSEFLNSRVLPLFSKYYGRDLLESYRIDCLVQGNDLTKYEGLKKQAENVLPPEGRLPEAYLKAEDILKMGQHPGPKIGQLLKEAFDKQLDGEIRSRQEALLWLENKC